MGTESYHNISLGKLYELRDFLNREGDFLNKIKKKLEFGLEIDHSSYAFSGGVVVLEGDGHEISSQRGLRIRGNNESIKQKLKLNLDLDLEKWE